MKKNIAKTMVGITVLAMAAGCADMSPTQRGPITRMDGPSAMPHSP